MDVHIILDRSVLFCRILYKWTDLKQQQQQQQHTRTHARTHARTQGNTHFDNNFQDLVNTVIEFIFLLITIKWHYCGKLRV